MANASTKSKDVGIVAKGYLCLYNFLQVLGWSYILYQILTYYVTKQEKSLWNIVGLHVNIFQTAALLEIIHAATRIVPSNPVITAFQVSSRVMIVWGVVIATPHSYAAASYGLPIALTAWCITEIIRYSYYFMNLIKYVPYFLTWLRYTTFIVLYPIGVTGELLCYYDAQKYAGSYPDAYSWSLPNKWNGSFSYHYALLAIMLSYTYLFPIMYLHMFAQRRKILGTDSTKKAQ